MKEGWMVDGRVSHLGSLERLAQHQEEKDEGMRGWMEMMVVGGGGKKEQQDKEKTNTVKKRGVNQHLQK